MAKDEPGGKGVQKEVNYKDSLNEQQKADLIRGATNMYQRGCFQRGYMLGEVIKEALALGSLEDLSKSYMVEESLLWGDTYKSDPGEKAPKLRVLDGGKRG